MPARKRPYSVDWAAYEHLLKQNKRLRRALKLAERTLEAWSPEDGDPWINEDGSVAPAIKAYNPALEAVRKALRETKP